MTRPFRQRLYDLADLAVAFATLEAVRLPAREPARAVPCTPGPFRCTPERRRVSSAAAVDPQLARRRRPVVHD